MREFSPRRLDQKPVQVLVGKIHQLFLLVAALFPNSRAIGQEVLPPANAKQVVVYATLFFQAMGPEDKGVRREKPVRQVEADQG